jgi:hypothetical protein
MAETTTLPLGLALSSVLAARLDGAGRLGLLAAVAEVPAQRSAAADTAAGTEVAVEVDVEVAVEDENAHARRS